ncbi:uncharacterized protein BX664DRAFT_332091 [Halteromyces radiatus]|uniref:uncharacterized protein n=1 Tax=Halteromyces radiatus TaxID=101107 RepID=UPI002220ADF6|nr:uncharacterized protein BX664DRAFT_332091 [Halteromyces radiatus]KAI8089068.1 hypothetical protein BX664DRAFT_332091 [Halteromyces radiatus]
MTGLVHFIFIILFYYNTFLFINKLYSVSLYLYAYLAIYFYITKHHTSAKASVKARC